MALQRLVIFLAALAMLAGGFWFWQTRTLRPAPDVGFKTIEGEALALQSFAGKPVLVTFWSTDCPGCIEEIPHLIELHRQFADRGLNIFAVAMHYDPPNQVLAMAKARQLPYKVVLDPTGEIAHAFGNVQLTPTTFLIDPRGDIVLQKLGVFDPDDMQARLQAMLSPPNG